MVKRWNKICLILAVVIIAACGENSQSTNQNLLVADTLLTNGKIYTVDSDQPWVDSVAIKGKEIVFVGASTAAKKFIGEHTEIIDLQGAMAMPGLNDLHVHPVYGYTAKLFECAFPPSFGPDDVATKVSECVENNPQAEWIVGGQWETDFFVKYKIKSPKKWLDRFSGDKAIFLRDSSFHNHWANSKALSLAGIDKDTPEVEGGKIVRDKASGEPLGLLHETAGDLVGAIIPDWTPEQYKKAAEQALKTANRFGITGFKEASSTVPRLQAYKSVVEEQDLTAHVGVAFSVAPLFSREKGVDIDRLNEIRSENRDNNLNTDFAKIFMDGVPSVSRTAAMLANYLPAHPGAPETRGKLLHSTEELAGMIEQLDAAGITVKIHAAGDWAVRASLDAIEIVREKNGNSGLWHEIGHAGFVHPSDIARFNQLGVLAEVSPYIWFPTVKTESIIRAVGKRGERYWPFKDMLEAGTEIVAGSDWPAGALPDMNPWVGMEAMISRRNPWGDFPGVMWKEQHVTLEQALQIYTKNGARGLKLADKTGSIEKGKLADIIVLKHNLFEIPVEEISDTQIAMTLFEGRVVYKQ